MPNTDYTLTIMNDSEYKLSIFVNGIQYNINNEGTGKSLSLADGQEELLYSISNLGNETKFLISRYVKIASKFNVL